MRNAEDQREIDDLVAANRRLTEQKEALAAENLNLQRHVSALLTLLAVIYSFTKMPAPIAQHWDRFYTNGMKRIGQIRAMANELQVSTPGHPMAIDQANRWVEITRAWLKQGLDYTPDPDGLPKKPVSGFTGRELENAALTITDTAMRSNRTSHAADARPGPDNTTLWSVTWMPGHDLTFNQAITAMTIAEVIGMTNNVELLHHIEGWADELGLTAERALELASRPIDECLINLSLSGLAVGGADNVYRHTRHTAQAWPVPGEPTLWSVTWLPGRQLTLNQANIAMTIAEMVVIHVDDFSDLQSPWWGVVERWAGRLGLTPQHAVVAASAPPEDYAPGGIWERVSALPDFTPKEDKTA
jgi:hypothetical protein